VKKAMITRDNNLQSVLKAKEHYALSVIIYCPFLVIVIPCLFGCSPQVKYVRPSYKAQQEAPGKALGKDTIVYRKKNVIIEDSKLKRIVDSYIGVPYKYGGTTRKGMDCSGFAWRIFTKLGFTDFPRTSSAKLHTLGKAVPLKKAKPGDLVFFKRWGRIFHVGIYMGNNMFAHASSKLGIAYTSLDDKYFGKRFKDIRRID
jgi:cell wall-associated NlpC family hydrolase